MAGGRCRRPGNLHSESPSFRSIGTDPDEWWSVEDFMPVAAAQVAEIPPFHYEWDDVEGFELGQVGWGAARVAAAAAGGQVVMSALVRELIGATPEFAFGDPFLVELKGLEGAHELVPVRRSEA